MSKSEGIRSTHRLWRLSRWAISLHLLWRWTWNYGDYCTYTNLSCRLSTSKMMKLLMKRVTQICFNWSYYDSVWQHQSWHQALCSFSYVVWWNCMISIEWTHYLKMPLESNIIIFLSVQNLEMEKMHSSQPNDGHNEIWQKECSSKNILNNRTFC